jgi:UDP-N-acetylmuramate dehydrogenase
MIQVNVDLAALNTLALPARARFFAELRNVAELPALLDFAAKQALPVLVIGGGSNVVFSQNFPGLVIKMLLQGVQIQAQAEARLVTAAAGESWPALVEYCLDHDCYGLENLSLIPGCVGAAPIQNIGAYGVELKDIFHSLRGWDCQQQQWRTLHKEDCDFAYRDSVFKHALKGQFIITEVTLALQSQPNTALAYSALGKALKAQGIDQPTPRQVADTVIAIRQSKLPDPVELPNAGSFFKNPVINEQQANDLLARYPDLVHYPQPNQQEKLAAAWLIDKAGWKGKRQGDVACHQQQALVLVNHGIADGQQILSFAKDIQADIQRQFAVQLEIEPSIY